MDYIKIVMQEFKLNDDDLYYSVTKQLIDLYINMIIKKISSEKIDRMFEEISNTSYFPSDNEIDSYYVFENLYYNYTMYNYSELKMTFKAFFRILKDLRNREIYSYVNINGYAKDYYLEDELPSILRQPSKPLETFEEIEDLIYQEVSKENAMAIVDLECAYWFPEIELDWDEWFIYCLIKRYSSRLFVETSSRQFKIATPIISINDDLDEFELNYISEYKNNETIAKKEMFDIEDIELENVEELLA